MCGWVAGPSAEVLVFFRSSLWRGVVLMVANGFAGVVGQAGRGLFKVMPDSLWRSETGKPRADPKTSTLFIIGDKGLRKSLLFKINETQLKALALPWGPALIQYPWINWKKFSACSMT
jgi:hypothetical protein